MLILKFVCPKRITLPYDAAASCEISVLFYVRVAKMRNVGMKDSRE